MRPEYWGIDPAVVVSRSGHLAVGGPCKRGGGSRRRSVRGHAPTRLAALRAAMQVDGHADFSELVKARQDALLQLIFCGAYARQPVCEFYVSTQQPLARDSLAQIANLPQITGEICDQPVDVRQDARQPRCWPLVKYLRV